MRALELDVDVKVILLDNSALGLVRQQQELFYQRHFVASRFDHRTDFVAVALAFGLRAHDLGCCADDARLLDQVLPMPGPALTRVPIDEKQQVLPMVPSGGAQRLSRGPRDRTRWPGKPASRRCARIRGTVTSSSRGSFREVQ
jgi:thiamine pyrophosphate-dependent acetolactate synthase large subunit-like protein